jgi:hypothetical protein
MGPEGPGKAIVGTTPSVDTFGLLWWDSNSGQLFVQYDDGSSVQWVSANSIDASTLEGSFLPITGGTMQGPLNYTATGGTVSRSAQDRAAEVFNVKDHGVKMDGVTDDFAALQAVVTLAAAVAGSVLYFPPSAHPLLLSQAIAIASGQTWRAHPGSVTIAPTSGNVATPLLWGVNTGGNVTIHGLTFDGIGQDFANTGPLAQAYHTNGLTLDQVTFQNSRGTAFNGSGVNDLIVRGCRFVNIGNHWKTTNNPVDTAQALNNTVGDGVTWGLRTRVEGCLFSDCGSDSLNLGGLQHVQVINNIFTRNITTWTIMPSSAYFAGIYALYCTDVVISGNLVVGMSGNGIDCPGVVDATISNNAVRGSGQGGIGLFGSPSMPEYLPVRNTRNVTVIGNVIENNGRWTGSPGRSGIDLSIGDNVRISNNIITDTQTTPTQQYGVKYFGTTPSAVWVDPSNYLDGNVVAPLSGLFLAGLKMDDATGQLYTAANMAVGGGLNVNGVLSCFGGANFSSAGASSVTDLSKHLALYGNVVGFNITAARLNYVVPSGNAHMFVVNGADRFAITGTGFGFNGTAAIVKPTVTGSKGSNTALASLLTALSAYGLVTDSST